MKQERNQILRFWLLLVVVALLSGAMYWLPERIGSWEIKQVDLLFSLREEREEQDWEANTPSSATDAAAPIQIADTISVDAPTATLRPSTPQRTAEETQVLQSQDAAHQAHVEASTDLDSDLVPIEDSQIGRGALAYFYGQLARRATLGRPVRIAVLGDSFIEGDIFTDALRQALQSRYGGGGVGWMPLSSEVAGFRVSVKHEFGKWQDVSILNKASAPVPMTGHYYTSSGSGSWVRYTLPHKDSSYEQATLYYSAASVVNASVRTEQDTLALALEPTNVGSIADKKLITASRNRLHFSLNGATDGLRLYGIALESLDGISVDNMSLRGNSGTILRGLNEEVGKAFAAARPYDLIILQYGLNVVSAKQSNYSHYGAQMDKVVAKLRSFYPESSILIFSVSDRGQRTAAGIQTLKTIPVLHAEQRALAQRHGLAFWSLTTAMQRLGGAEQMTNKGQMAKDYTHLSHKGGREVAKLFVKALELEKNYYE